MRDAIIRVAADGSAGSRRALEWALDEAGLRGCAVELVSVYDPARDGGRAAAESAVHATMDDIVAGRGELPTVSWHVVAGEPADVLTRESAHSELLVMGSHGVTGLRHSALGSVADLCARTAECPVVILPTLSHSPHVGQDLGAPRSEAVRKEVSP
jgi:nucleotide-binding universal stress UspA family protein